MITFTEKKEFYHFINHYEGDLIIKHNKVYDGNKLVAIMDFKSQMKFKAFIAGPITGYDLTERAKVFRETEYKLKGLGYEVFNPFKNGVPLEADAKVHERADMKVLPYCEYIYLLDGWKNSKGALLEYDVAMACGIKELKI